MNRMTIDEQARKLVAAVSQSLSSKMDGLQPGQPLLAELYLRTRDRLREIGDLEIAGDDAAEGLALTIYLVWLAEVEAPSPDLLIELKDSVRAALRDLAASQQRERETAVRPEPARPQYRHGGKK